MSPTEHIDAFYKAIMAKDAEKIGSYYVPDEDTYVILEGPRLATMGFSKIATGWADFCTSGLSLTSIHWIDGPFEEIMGEAAWIAGIIRLEITVQERSFTQTFRASFVMKKVGASWHIRHEHVSGALEDPYGIGDWLKKV